MIANALTLLKDYQTGIGSLIGMLALLVVAWVAWWLNRIRDEKLRREEEKSTAAALYGEIRELRERIAKLANIVAGHESRDKRPIKELLQSCMPGKPLIYESLVGKFGILPNKFVLSIVRFHAYVGEVIRGVALYSAEIEPEYSPLVILDPAISAVDEAGTALDLLGNALKIPGEPSPNISEAIEMKMKEDYLFEQAKQERDNPH